MELGVADFQTNPFDQLFGWKVQGAPPDKEVWGRDVLDEFSPMVEETVIHPWHQFNSKMRLSQMSLNCWEWAMFWIQRLCAWRMSCLSLKEINRTCTKRKTCIGANVTIWTCFAGRMCNNPISSASYSKTSETSSYAQKWSTHRPTKFIIFRLF